MTVKNFIDEIKLRLSRIVSGIEVNDYELVDMINNHRLAVQRATIPYLYNRYGDIINIPFNAGTLDTDMINQNYVAGINYVVYQYNLPDNFIQPINLIFQHRINDNETIRREARQISEREIYTVLLHDWIQPSYDNPVYATKQYSVTIAPELPGSNKLIVGFTYDSNLGDPTTWLGGWQLWYVRALDMLDYDNDLEFTLSPDLEQLVILEVIKNILQDISPTTDLSMIRRDIQMAYQNLQQNYYIEEAMKVQLLESTKTGGGI